jgi:hypothetical protein
MGQQQREQQQEQMKLKQAEHKMLLEAAKLKNEKEARTAEAEARKQQLLASIFGPELAGGQQAQPQSGSSSGLQFGQTFGSESSQATQPKPQSRLLDIISDPLKAAALKEMTGVDFLGAHNAMRQGMAENRMQGAEQRQWAEFLWRMKDAEQGRQMQAGQGSIVMRDVPGGGQNPVWLPNNPSAAARYGIGGGGLGQAPPSLGGAGGGPPQPFKLPESQKPITPDEFSLWRHPEGRRPKQGMTPAEAQSQGYVRFTAPEVGKIDLLENGIDVINEIENLMIAAGIPKSGESNRFSGGLMREGKAFFQAGREGQTLAKLRDYIAANKATIARIGGEVGNLAEKEQQDVLSGLGQIGDAGPKAWESFNLIKRKYLRIKARKYGLMPDKVDETVDMVFNPLTGQLEPAK